MVVGGIVLRDAVAIVVLAVVAVRVGAGAALDMAVRVSLVAVTAAAATANGRVEVVAAGDVDEIEELTTDRFDGSMLLRLATFMMIR